MNWEDQRERIRRFLRDPDGNIWSATLLRRLFNDEQKAVNAATGVLEGVEAVRIPPRYGSSYMFDCEWAHTTTKQYRCLTYYAQGDIVLCHRWEAQAVHGLDVSASSEGDAFVHPWEAWYTIGDPGKPVPCWFPRTFHKARYIAWDKEPLVWMPLKEIQSDDPSWVTRSGDPYAYTRLDEIENDFVLYPRPSTAVWDDDSGTGNVAIFEDGDSNADNYALMTDRTGSLLNDDMGIATDIVSADDNVFIIFDALPEDIEKDDQESDYPPFLRKQIEYGVIAQAYKANTDGRIKSLADYWDWRRSLGIEMIKLYKMKRKADRDYRLKTQGSPPKRTRRDPRLPDGYPAIIR